MQRGKFEHVVWNHSNKEKEGGSKLATAVTHAHVCVSNTATSKESPFLRQFFSWKIMLLQNIRCECEMSLFSHHKCTLSSHAIKTLSCEFPHEKSIKHIHSSAHPSGNESEFNLTLTFQRALGYFFSQCKSQVCVTSLSSVGTKHLAHSLISRLYYLRCMSTARSFESSFHFIVEKSPVGFANTLPNLISSIT